MLKQKLTKEGKDAIYKPTPLKGVDAYIAESLESLLNDKLLLALKIYGIDHSLVKKMYCIKYNIEPKNAKSHFYSNVELQKKLKG